MSDVRKYFESTIPNAFIRRTLFSQLLLSVDECRKTSEAWSVTHLKNGFRLNIGNVEALTVFLCDALVKDESFRVVRFRILLSGGDPSEILNLNESERVDQLGYASVAKANWAYQVDLENIEGKGRPTSVKRLGSQLKLAEHLRNDFIQTACRTPTGKVRGRSNFARTHCPDLIEYARSICGSRAENTQGWYNGYSWRERAAKLKEAHRLAGLGELEPASGPCELCGDPDANVNYHGEDYSLPYKWGKGAEFALCDHCHLHKLHKRFSNPVRWSVFLAHVRRGGYASDLKKKEIKVELEMLAKAMNKGDTFPLKILRPYHKNIGSEWFAKLSTDPKSLTDPSSRPRP